MPPWPAHNQHQPHLYMQPGAYPGSSSGSPMNFNGYYPPTTYGASSSGPAYRGGYSAANARGGSPSYAATTGPAHGQYAAPAFNNGPSFGTSGGYGNGYTTTSGAPYNPAFDPTLLAGMQNMGFGK